MGWTHWVCFYVRDNKSYYVDLFGGPPNIFLLKQLLKSVFFDDYSFQDINISICGTYCLYFFNLTKRMNYYNAVVKMCFEQTEAKKYIR